VKLAEFLQLPLTIWETQVMVRLIVCNDIDPSSAFQAEFIMKLKLLREALSSLPRLWQREICASEILFSFDGGSDSRILECGSNDAIESLEIVEELRCK